MTSPPSAQTPRRNEPCPCGSRKKCKNCHGRGASPAQRVAGTRPSSAGVDQQFAKAFEPFQQGAFAQSADVCAAIIDSQPEHVLAHHLLGLCQHQLQDFAAARRWLERAAELVPDEAFLAKPLAILDPLMRRDGYLES